LPKRIIVMNKHTHDPREFVRGLKQILVSDSKRIGFLTGAGTSMVKEKPKPPTEDKKVTEFDPLICGTKEMTSIVEKLFEGNAEKIKFHTALQSIRKELESEKQKVHIESIVSKISQKEIVVGTETLCGLTKEELAELRVEIENKIKDLVSIHKDPNFFKWDITHYKFASWIADANRKNFIEIFTTNYDYLFEIAFEKNSIPYFDGFIGSFNPAFHSYSVEDDLLLKGWSKLWKIHGSLGWDYDKEDKKFIRGNKDSGTIIVYPSIFKYDKSKKQPYVSFLDRLNRFIKTDDTVLFICGYAFGDEHINDTILNALSKSRTSAAIVFLYDDFEENSEIAQLAINEPRMSIYGLRKAVIGGKYGCWQLKSQPAQEDDIQIGSYFLQDAPVPKEEKGMGDEENSMQGNFKLVDFSELVSFLSELNYSNYRITKK
jgi:hypothetical protein